jgi:hypothetical protein
VNWPDAILDHAQPSYQTLSAKIDRHVGGVLGLLDDLVRPSEHRRRDREAEGPGRLEVDHQVEDGGLFDREIGGPCAFEDSVNLTRRAPPDRLEVGRVRHEAAGRHVLALVVHPREAVPEREVSEDRDVRCPGEHRVPGHDQCLSAIPDHRAEGPGEVAGRAGRDELELEAEARSVRLPLCSELLPGIRRPGSPTRLPSRGWGESP